MSTIGVALFATFLIGLATTVVVLLIGFGGNAVDWLRRRRELETPPEAEWRLHD